MRYVDTGIDPEDSLGRWLSEELAAGDPLTALWCQTAYFGLDGAAYIAQILQQHAERLGHVAVLLGANERALTGRDVEALRLLVEPDGMSRRLAIVELPGALFHGKTVVAAREDGSLVGYAGSGNITARGLNGKNAETGLVVDTRHGDDEATVRDMAAAVDRWFNEPPQPIYELSDTDDVARLVAAQVLSVFRERRQPVSNSSAPRETTLPPRAPRRRSPPLPQGLVQRADVFKRAPAPTASAAVRPSSRERQDEGAVSSGAEVVSLAEEWSKSLSTSDAQRKPSGNQRGAITLVQGNRPDIDRETFFREVLLAEEDWHEERTQTDQARETAVVPMRTTIVGSDLGTLGIRFTNAPNRQSDQRNYTSLLHVDAFRDELNATDITGMTITITKHDDGSFDLSIA